jgi:hypothetical protein
MKLLCGPSFKNALLSGDKTVLKNLEGVHSWCLVLNEGTVAQYFWRAGPFPLLAISDASDALYFSNVQPEREDKGKVVPVLLLTEHHAIKAYWGNGGTVPRILDLGTRWR